MLSSFELYKIWAPEPETVCWSVWAKPALFMSNPITTDDKMEIPEIKWLNRVDFGTAIIVDMPGKSGVAQSLALARLGYRPVPLYNGVRGPMSSSDLVNSTEIISALHEGADILSTAPIHYDAPPVFMLDSNRMSSVGKGPGKFDNRWCVFPQDMPSADFLREKGIHTIIVRTYELKTDLSHILKRYQESGIGIFTYAPYTGIVEKKITKPPYFNSFMHRFAVILGLRRSTVGGFGAKIPEAEQSSSGYYGGIG
jgi:hypothetical protein